MNYLLVLKGNGGDIADIPLGVWHIDPWERPTTGQQLTYKGKTYEVAYTSPANPTDTQTATIYLEPINPTYPYKRL